MAEILAHCRAQHRALQRGREGALFQPREGQSLPEATQQQLSQDPGALRSLPHQSTAR